MKKDKTKETNQAASLLGRRSAEVRKEKWGKKEFADKLRSWGKLGGRPRVPDDEVKPGALYQRARRERLKKEAAKAARKEQKKDGKKRS